MFTIRLNVSTAFGTVALLAAIELPAGAQQATPVGLTSRRVDALADRALSGRSECRSPVPAIPGTFAAASSSRITHAGRGALWGLAVYGVLAAVYIAHESATCHGPKCFGEGYAWIGLAAGVPLAAGVGAGVGALWPTGP